MTATGWSIDYICETFAADQLQAFYTEMLKMQGQNILQTARATRTAFHADKSEWKEFVRQFEGGPASTARRISPYLTMAPNKALQNIDVSTWGDLD